MGAPGGPIDRALERRQAILHRQAGVGAHTGRGDLAQAAQPGHGPALDVRAAARPVDVGEVEHHAADQAAMVA